MILYCFIHSLCRLYEDNDTTRHSTEIRHIVTGHRGGEWILTIQKSKPTIIVHRPCWMSELETTIQRVEMRNVKEHQMCWVEHVSVVLGRFPRQCWYHRYQLELSEWNEKLEIDSFAIFIVRILSTSMERKIKISLERCCGCLHIRWIHHFYFTFFMMIVGCVWEADSELVKCCSMCSSKNNSRARKNGHRVRYMNS